MNFIDAKSPTYLMSQMSSQKHNITRWIISPQTITKETSNCWNHRTIALNNLLSFQVIAFSYLNDPTGKTLSIF